MYKNAAGSLYACHRSKSKRVPHDQPNRSSTIDSNLFWIAKKFDQNFKLTFELPKVQKQNNKEIGYWRAEHSSDLRNMATAEAVGLVDGFPLQHSSVYVETFHPMSAFVWKIPSRYCSCCANLFSRFAWVMLDVCADAHIRVHSQLVLHAKTSLAASCQRSLERVKHRK